MLGLFLIVISDEKSDAMNGATYLYGASIQITFLSIFGQLLTNKFESLSEAVYEMPWYLENRKSFSMTIILLQMKLRQPVKISAGKFFDLSHATYATIVHSSFTYFTVLREVTGNN
ncbi:PREDICTED: odorant receptor 43a-like [Nicrophorus vespilloides]|uniref:Odorant receptor 43a-like n=1 Tax=Nicrophorus vespilloides TaxID=110193 RepID=A0ABM1NAR1_NICVS|nr:PREDICTED: odorant receptor 43a-like [Nicrophorus vespilloides]